MTKVTSPLFGSSARGNVGDLGTFRMGRHGPEFIAIAQGSGGHSEAQQRRRDCFAEAKAAHSALTPVDWEVGGKIGTHRVPSWPVFWRQWLIDHPECNE